MDRRRLGRTGHESSLAVLGAAAFWDATADDVDGALRAALAAGVNHIDVAPRYGKAETLLGFFLPPVRGRVFLAGKTTRAHPDGVRAQLERSLELLETDHFDLYQLHAVTSLEELGRRREAVQAIFRARDEGLVRFVGITGHDMTTAAAQAEALRRYDLDTVMFPVAPRLWSDPAYRSDAEALLSLAAERDVGVLAIKAAAAGPKRPGSDAATWYEPHRSPEAVERGVRFALSVEGVHACCTPGDVRLLPLALEAARRFRPMDEGEMAAAVEAAAGDRLIFPMPGR